MLMTLAAKFKSATGQKGPFGSFNQSLKKEALTTFRTIVILSPYFPVAGLRNSSTIGIITAAARNIRWKTLT